jgi:predicted permease
MVTRWLTGLRLRWRALMKGAALDRDLDRELRSHLDDEAEARMARGLPPDEARRQSRVAFGSTVAATEACREARGVSVAQNLVRDLRYGWRALVRQPLLLVAASTSIALGVGVNLTLFSLASELLFATPSASRPDELVHIRTGNGSHVPYAQWRDLAEVGALDGLAGYRLELTANWRRGDETVAVLPMVVTANYFDMMGLPLAIGRGFGPDEARAERDPRLVVLTDGFWRRQLGARPDILGASLILNGASYDVIGVLPRGSRSLAPFGIEPDLYLPLASSLVPAIETPRAPVLQLVGRLAPDQTMEQGREVVETAARRIGEAHGDPEFSIVTVFSGVGGLGQAGEFDVVVVFFGVLMAVAGLVLLIACANVAGLLLARSAARRREVAMRVALGASRLRLLQQFLTESLLLAGVGTAAGLALAAAAGVGLSRVSLPLPVPVSLRTVVDERLLLFALGLVLVSTVFSGLAPALHATRAAIAPATRPGEPGGRTRRFALRRVLVAGQVAVSALLLVIALVFVRNLLLTTAVDPGFDVERTLVARVQFVEGRQGTPAQPAMARLTDAVRALPGVASAAFTDSVPLTLYFGATVGTALRIGDAADPIRTDYTRAIIGPGFLETMGIEVRGREFTAADGRGAPPVTIVNEAFARRYLGDGSPIGRTISDPRDEARRTWRIIGVAADSKYRTPGEAQSPAMYLPVLQAEAIARLSHVVVRAAGDPAPLVPAVRDVLLSLDPSAAVTVETTRAALTLVFLPSRIGAGLLGAIGVLGTVLAMVGLYGVVSFAVSRRTAEIGLRLAIGASRRSVAVLVIRDVAAVVGAGLVVGLGLGLLATQALATFLVAGLSPSDPASILATAALLLAACLAAAAPPMRRATRIDPIVALRQD